MTEWVFILITAPVLLGDPGHITLIPMVDQASCLKSAMGTWQENLRTSTALSQPLCMPKGDSLLLVTLANCHDRDIHHNPDRMDWSCEGIAKNGKQK
ncbi:MAG: hypothetical protein ABSG12_11915 [Steroidobacteraceae bacterium]